MGYHTFYPNYQALQKDAEWMWLYQTIREVYIKNSSFSGYYQRLSEGRIPIHVLANWARSISEDLYVSHIPTEKLDQWQQYFKSEVYTRASPVFDDFPVFEENEMGCLWGAVFFCLSVHYEKDIYDPLMDRITYCGCQLKEGTPYFLHFYNAARNICGKDFYLTSNSNDDESNFPNDNHTDIIADAINSQDVFNGFEALTVNERCRARQVLNDVLSESAAWKSMCREMKRRGWFKEMINPATVYNVAGDYVGTKHVGYEVNGVAAGGTGITITKDREEYETRRH